MIAEMIHYIKSMHETIAYFFLALLLVNVLGFIRGWSMSELKVRYILLFLLKIDIGLILSAVLFMILANIPDIIALFMNH